MKRWLLLLALVTAFTHMGVAQSRGNMDEWIYDEVGEAVAFNQRQIRYYIDRPSYEDRVPLLVVIDGSGCGGQMRPVLDALYRPGPRAAHTYARLRVEKPGVKSTSTGENCSDEFRKGYSIENRVSDHLRVLAKLDSAGEWWNGDIYVWGWSDGGDIAAQLTLFHPGVKRAVFGAVGGGITFKELFEDYWACPDSRLDAEEREECVTGLREQFGAIEDNPTWTETWGGEDNSWRVWSDRLNRKLVAPLADLKRPFLIVHGELDFNSVPVDSARLLVSELSKIGSTHYEYWEVACMGHSWLDLQQPSSAHLEVAMIDWLFGVETADGGITMSNRSDIRKPCEQESSSE